MQGVVADVNWRWYGVDARRVEAEGGLSRRWPVTRPAGGVAAVGEPLGRHLEAQLWLCVQLH